MVGGSNPPSPVGAFLGQVNYPMARYVILRMGHTGFFTIIRPGNSFIAGRAENCRVPYRHRPASPPSQVYGYSYLITAAVNVINDYYDTAIDAINRPGRPIPSCAVSRDAALVYAGILFSWAFCSLVLPRCSASRSPCSIQSFLLSTRPVLFVRHFSGI